MKQYLRSLILLAWLLILGGCNYAKKINTPSPGDPLPSLSVVTDGTEPGRIVDETGRQVLLRGVNINSHIEYWQSDPDIQTNFPLSEEDADLMASMGWNMVRLCISWSRVEPQPGEYDESYLNEVAASVKMLADRSIYTLLDLHQDAWGASLAAPPGTICKEGRPAGGWDGMRKEFMNTIRKMAVRFAPGHLDRVDWSKDDSAIAASGKEAPAGNILEIFVPTENPSYANIESTGLSEVKSTPWFGGTLIYAPATGGAWSIHIKIKQ